MRTVKLDGAHMTDKQSAHVYMQLQLNITGYHGYNLDALYDALSVYDKELTVMLINKPEMIQQLGEYGEQLIKTFLDAERTSNLILFKVI